MKTTKILGATTLAGALLFTGVNAHAAESQVTPNNAANIATDVMKRDGQSPENVNFRNAEDKGDYYFINYSNKSGAGVGGVRVYKDGTVEAVSGILGADDDSKAEFEKAGKYEFANAQNNAQQTQATDNTVAAQNNGQQGQATDNTVTQDNTQAQSEAQALPETGETSNSTLVTMIAAVMLAAGALLTFKRFSKNNK
ncbi:LPXTG cell wall anchor domain-containing protein [Staphylococcus pasteuri]|uniref:LPXTG cell wall anchor domain-containing protein n=1 Tax=Staphylococcus pasteuri TaxID=45972 RepID=UPI003132C467